jgi:predicted DNA-binding mobile mystery protein A
MDIKQTIQAQYRETIDEIVPHVSLLARPPEGWLRTVRKALGMSGAQLARRMGVTRARVAAAERAELDHSATLRSMQAAAAAMGCKFVYAIVPDESIENLVAARAREKASAFVKTASQHMALEDQALPPAKIQQSMDRLTRELMHEMPRNLWDDD